MEKREIKFRAWLTEKKEMIDCVNLGLLDLFGGRMGLDGFFYWFDEERYGDKVNCVLMQFTGLKDKNGKEKYHKDIVRDEWGGVYIIEWDDKDASFYHDQIHYGSVALEGYKLWREDYTEMVGNIYENPELLE